MTCAHLAPNYGTGGLGMLLSIIIAKMTGNKNDRIISNTVYTSFPFWVSFSKPLRVHLDRAGL